MRHRQILGSRFRAARSLLGLSRRELAAMAGLSEARLRRLESDNAVPIDSAGEAAQKVIGILERHGVRFVERGDMVDAPGVTLEAGPKDLIGEEEARALLQAACAAVGTQGVFASILRVAKSDVTMALSGKRRISGRIAAAIGLQTVRHVTYTEGSSGGVVSPAEARARLRRAVDEAGSQVAFARLVGTTKATISSQLAGRNLIDGKVAGALGLTPVETRVFRRVDPSEEG